MNRLLLAGLLSCAVSAQALAALPAGTVAPTFKATASLAGKEFSYDLANALTKGPVVVYFYPGAFTVACNIQAHTFAQDMDQFHSAGATVIGVSLDKIETLDAFSSDPQYCAASSPSLRMRTAASRRATTLSIKTLPAGREGRGFARHQHRSRLRGAHDVHHYQGRQDCCDRRGREPGRQCREDPDDCAGHCRWQAGRLKRSALPLSRQLNADGAVIAAHDLRVDLRALHLLAQ